MKIIDEIKQITADQVAKKQDAAKLNYPKIIEKIKVAAGYGNSDCTLSLREMNEYDKKLLEQDGFVVRLEEKKFKNDYKSLNPYKETQEQEWVIKW